MEATLMQILGDGQVTADNRDQYADGRASRVFAEYCIDADQRKQNYKDFLIGLLRQHNCKRVLDVACGTGVDSVMLLEAGFEVVSVDASDKQLKYALKKRWDRRHEEAFDKWVIEEANWITLLEDIQPLISDGFDAVICIGHAFPFLLDSFGDQREQKRALSNFERCLKPGGLLIIDHRNFDGIIKSGQTPPDSPYYNFQKLKCITSVVLTNGEPSLVISDYRLKLDVSDDEKNGKGNLKDDGFRMLFYPHTLKKFTQLLKETLPQGTKLTTYADFKPLGLIENPNYYIHTLEKLT